MVIGALIKKGAADLAASSTTPALDARLLLAHAAKISQTFILANPCADVPERNYWEYIARRVKGEPTAYIVGVKEFMSLPFRVNRNVLIPRPDTEVLVEWAIEQFKSSAPRILDLGTGSGCIGISLCRYIRGARAVLTDASPTALEVARDNAVANNVDGRVELMEMDMTHPRNDIGRFDLIVSNPPYIKTDDLPGLAVSRFEPRTALDGGADGLRFYHALVRMDGYLAPGGALAVEVGHDQAEAVQKLLQSVFPETNVFRDLAGIARVVASRRGLGR